MSRITFAGALKEIKDWFTSSTPTEEGGGKPKTDEIICPRCDETLELIHPSVSDILTVMIYKCPNCGLIDERQFDENKELTKEIFVYDSKKSENSYSELLSLIDYKAFNLDRLWEVCGELCYPILMRTEFSTNINLFFIPVTDTLQQNSIEGYLITHSDILIKAKIEKSNNLSYFMNPYLFRLPHPTFMYGTTHIPGNINILSVSPIRYRHKIKSKSGLGIHELYIIQDFPIPCYSIEVFIRYCTTGDIPDSTPIAEVMDSIDMENIIMNGSNVHTAQGYYINAVRLSRVNLYSMGSTDLTPGERKSFYEAIKQFFELTGI